MTNTEDVSRCESCGLFANVELYKCDCGRMVCPMCCDVFHNIMADPTDSDVVSCRGCEEDRREQHHTCRAGPD